MQPSTSEGNVHVSVGVLGNLFPFKYYSLLSDHSVTVRLRELFLQFVRLYKLCTTILIIIYIYMHKSISHIYSYTPGHIYT